MSEKEQNLTKNQRIVLDFLESAKEPLGAYSILYNIEEKGIKSPLQVYRALDKLMEIGKVHKIESKNSYIVCTNKDCSKLKSTSFLICEKCENVSEIKENHLLDDLSNLTQRSGFSYLNHSLEIYGFCKNCTNNAQA